MQQSWDLGFPLPHLAPNPEQGRRPWWHDLSRQRQGLTNLARLTLVAATSDLADRIEVWLSYEHLINRMSPGDVSGILNNGLLLAVLPLPGEKSDTISTIIRRHVDHIGLVITGQGDRCPDWLETISRQHRTIVPVFPASPAALQVAARNLEHLVSSHPEYFVATVSEPPRSVPPTA